MKSIIFICFLFNSLVFNLQSKTKVSKLLSLNDPWSLTFVDNNLILITEKKGNIKLFNERKKTIINIPHNLSVHNQGQGGLLDILYKKDKIYISYAESLKKSFSTTSIAVASYNVNNLIFKNIFQAKPPIKSNYHFGSRLAFRENYLYASIGERGKGMIAQDGTKHPGSIIRIYKDGKIPKDNPLFIYKNNWLPEIYQIGLRNPQGLELSPFDNQIYITNHGAMGGDFFGRVYFGGNYGWKLLGWGGRNYTGSKIGPKWKEGFNKPINYWIPSVGISSFIIYKGEEFSNWNGHAIIGSLKQKSLYKLRFDNENNLLDLITILKDRIGIIRDIEVHPNTGKIYLISKNFLWLLEKEI